MAGPTNARQHLREEPDALAAHVRICAGGPQQCGFLPRYAAPLVATGFPCDLATLHAFCWEKEKSAKRPTRERGRLARPQPRWPPLSFLRNSNPSRIRREHCRPNRRRAKARCVAPIGGVDQGRAKKCGRDARAPGWAAPLVAVGFPGDLATLYAVCSERRKSREAARGRLARMLLPYHHPSRVGWPRTLRPLNPLILCILCIHCSKKEIGNLRQSNWRR